MPFFRYPWRSLFSKKAIEADEPETVESVEILSETDVTPEQYTSLPTHSINTKHLSDASSSIDGYLSRSYEELGYKDAYDHPDIKYLEVGKKFLISNMISLLKKANESFMFQKTELEFAITTHEKLGEMDTVGYLKSRLKKFELKISRITEFLAEMHSNIGESERVLLSYERGFRRGLAEITRSKFK